MYIYIYICFDGSSELCKNTSANVDFMDYVCMDNSLNWVEYWAWSSPSLHEFHITYRYHQLQSFRPGSSLPLAPKCCHAALTWLDGFPAKIPENGDGQLANSRNWEGPRCCSKFFLDHGAEIDLTSGCQYAPICDNATRKFYLYGMLVKQKDSAMVSGNLPVSQLRLEELKPSKATAWNHTAAWWLC